MLKNLWKTLPISLVCALAQANTITVATPAANNTLAPAASTSTTAAPKAEEAPKWSFRMGIGPSYTMGAQAKPDGSRSESLSTSFTPSVGYGNWTLMLFELYSQDLKNASGGGNFIDPMLFLSRKSIPLGDYLSIGLGANLTIPMTDSTKNNVNLLYGIGGSAQLNLNTKTLGMDAWKISYYLAGNRNFTQFSTTSAGEPITMGRIRQRINVGYGFTENFSLSTRFEFDSNYSAEGVVRNKFMHYETLGYQITDSIGISAGHTNANTLLDGTTYQSNLKFFDENTSEYSVGLDISL